MATTDGFAGVRLPRSPVYGTKYMVVSGHSQATLAGLRTFERGGSIADAMVAASAVLATVLPQATSLGGDAFILRHDAKTGKTEGLNASGPAARGATLDLYRSKGSEIHDRGALAFSIPGLVRGWEELHKKHGRLPWRELFKDAVEVARAHPLSRVLAAGLHLYRPAVEADPGCRAIWFKDGEPLKAGDIVRQPALAETLQEIAEKGSAAYYEGRIGRSIADYARKNGGVATPADFEGYKPEWVAPLSTDYRGLDVRVMPPNSYGLLMLMQLNALSELTSAEIAGAEIAGAEARRLAWQMRAMRAAFAEGQRFIADPRTNPAPIEKLLGADMTATLRRAVRTGEHPSLPLRHPAGGTSCIVLADAAGNAMSVVQSVFHVFGAAFLDPGTGILMNNRMTGFRLDPSHPSALAPGKRPSHTLNPVIVTKDNKPRYLMTTPGGPAQTISHVQMLTGMVDRGLEVSAAIEAPRWSLNLAGELLLDEQFSQETERRLEAEYGLKTKRASGAAFFGSAKVIEIAPNGVMLGAADHRREAYAAGA
jgi:gamma-glutamyltranspeptidase/glutathione hydrolase